MIAQTLNMLLPTNVWADDPAHGRNAHAQESVRDLFLRIKDELLWPRILVRHAPPPDEI